MNDLATLGGLALVGVGLWAVVGWLAIAGVGRWRRGTAGGRWSVAAATLFAPMAALEICAVSLITLRALLMHGVRNGPDLPSWIYEAVELAMPPAALALTAGLAALALAGRAALAAAVATAPATDPTADLGEHE